MAQKDVGNKVPIYKLFSYKVQWRTLSLTYLIASLKERTKKKMEKIHVIKHILLLPQTTDL